jgi:hypothetical protein
MTEKEQTLVQALGMQDAIFLALRKAGWDSEYGNKNRSQWQAAFPDRGLPLRSGRVTGAERARFARVMVQLRTESLLKVFRADDEKVPRIRLTPKGETEARRLCGLPGIDVSIGALSELLAGRAIDPLMWTSEYVPAAAASGNCLGVDKHDLMAVENLFLPALALGLCEVHSDAHGHASYRLTESGLAAIKERGGKVTEKEQGDEAEDADCRRAYLAAVKETLTRMRSEEPADVRDIGPCPLPASRPFNAREPWAEGMRRLAEKRDVG